MRKPDQGTAAVSLVTALGPGIPSANDGSMSATRTRRHSWGTSQREENRAADHVTGYLNTLTAHRAASAAPASSKEFLMHKRRFLSGLVALGLALTLSGGVHWATTLAADITCTGQVGKDSEKPTCRGTKRDDVITGSPLRDNVVAGRGDDTVNGLGGMDFLQGQKGDDTLDGGASNDWLIGQLGSDLSIGGPGSDVVYDNVDEVVSDVLEGGDGDDYVEGNGGDDTLDGGPGDDKMFGWTDDDTITGGDGADLILPEQGSDTIDAGGGDDFIDAVEKETPGSVDTITCGGGEDEVWANDNDDVAADCEHVTRFPDAVSALSAKQQKATAATRDRERERFWKEHRSDR
jgi:Ca2+-binding RTX toxin-like protein